MTPLATRVLTLAVAGALTLGAAASWACDKSAKTASATSCSVKHSVACAKACAAPSSVTAKKATPASKSAATAPKKSAPSEAGMRAYRDPETGVLTSPPALKAADGLPVLEDAPADLPQVPGSRGGYMIDLQGYGQDYATLQIDAKGNRILKCSPNPRATLKTAPAAAATLARPEK